MVWRSLYPTPLDGAMRLLACVLGGAQWVFLAGFRGGGDRLLIAARGKFATLLEKDSDEVLEHRFVRGRGFAGSLSGHGGLTGEDELRDVSKSDGVAAGDALGSELPYEIAEEQIDLGSGCETVDVGEKLGGEDLRIDRGNTGSKTVRVIGAEGRARGSLRRAMMLVDQHVATLAFGADVLAMMVDGGANRSVEFGGHS